jgi:hypothetical protein
MIYPYLLVLIYSGLSIEAEPRADLQLCVEEAGKRVGEEMKVHYWAAGEPLPKVVLAFCVQGSTSLQ